MPCKVAVKGPGECVDSAALLSSGDSYDLVTLCCYLAQAEMVLCSKDSPDSEACSMLKNGQKCCRKEVANEIESPS